MKKMFSFILLAFICICGYAQTIDPALLEEMGRHRDNEKIRVFVIMRQQYDQQQLNLRADQFTTRAERREFVVNELKQFAEASQYDLRHSLSEMQRADLVTEPKVLWMANAISFEATRGAILSLADRSDIMVIGFDEERNWIPDGEASQPADPTREITSNVTQVNADQVWNLGYTGQGVVVAIIDTGVNYNHLDLADHLWDGGAEFPNHGYDVYDNDNDPMDEHVKYDQYGNIVSHGHGTHCAGTLCGDGTAGSQTGIAPDATLMCVKCTNSSGNCANSHIISAMQWAVDHGCDIISMSIGGNGDPPAEQTLLRNTCVNVLNAGVIAAIAAGNEGNKLSQYPIPFNVALPGGCPPPYLDPDQQQNPGGLSCSVCVGAVDSNDVAADFTSHGPRDWSESDYADYPYTPGSQSEFGLIRPDVCAPGVDIISTDSWNTSGYQTKDGTSMATPCVAGCMALMLSKNPNATPAELCRILEETAVPLSIRKSNIYGCGRVDALAAVTDDYAFSVVCSTGQRLYYNITDATNHYVEITCPGTSNIYPWNGYTKPTGAIVLPSYVTYRGVTYVVKGIGDNAFHGCSGLTGSLTIPNSVTEIGWKAFTDCSGLTSINIPNTINSIGYNAFKGTGWYAAQSNGIVYLGNWCLGYKGIKPTGTLNLNGNTRGIAGGAFEDCSGLTGLLAIPNSVIYIGDYAFKGCSGLTGSLAIPNPVIYIGDYAFKGCSGLTGSLVIPNSVIYLGDLAFQGCSGLTGSLTIPNSVTRIREKTFQGCSGFNGTLTIPNSVTIIDNYAFSGCSGFTGSLTIPDFVITIGYSAFQNCCGFTGSLTIGTGLTSIGGMAFKDCTGFTQVNYNAIDCSAITDGDKPFINCGGTLTIGSSVQKIRAYMFDSSGFTGTLTIPNSVTEIRGYAFYNCSGFTGSLTIPNSVTFIGAYAFCGCSGFTGSLTITNSETMIRNYVFAGCSGFTGSLTIPNSVTLIGDYAFAMCSGLTGSLTIGNSVTTIEKGAFVGCANMSNMEVLAETPPTLGSLAFYNVPTTIPVHVRCTSLEDYQAASGWDAFTNYQCMNYDFSALCSTGQRLYYNIIHPVEPYVEITCPGTSSTNPWNGYTQPTGNIILPSYVSYGDALYIVKRIGDNAFRGCSGLTGSLTIPNSVTTIKTTAFYGCSGFTGSLIIPNSVTSIGGSAFAFCTGFTGSLTIGNSVTTIHNGAFYGCNGFTGSLTIGNSVTSIDSYAFNGCSGFTSMTVYPETPPTLGTNAFQNVPTGIPVGVPCGSLLDYQDASGWYEFYNMHRINNNCDLLTYSINDDGVSVTVTGHVDGIIATGSLTIPETTTIDGVTYAVTAIGVEAFRNYTQLTGSLTIPNSVTTIGNNAFRGCTGFTGSLTIPNSVTTIDNDAFRGCTGFNGSLTLPSSLTSLGAFAFYSCSGFTGSLTIPNSLTSVGTCAFCYCTGFTGSLTIPNAVTFLEDWAFGNCTGLTSMTVLPETPPGLGTSVFSNVPTGIPVYVPCGSLPDYQSASGWSNFTNMQCLLETLTVYDGTVTNNRIPAYIFYFDGFTRSQFVIPAADLTEMTGSPISSMTFYTTSQNIPYTTDCPADVYLKEVDYTSISTYESKASATTVYSGYFDIVSKGSGGEMTIYFNSPYIYNGGNLLVGIENTDYYSFRNIHFYGQTVSGASISGASASSTETIPADQQNFIPKTTFGYQPSMCVPRNLPYTYGFEEEGEFDCWTMLNCHTSSMISSAAKHQGNNGFQFRYTYNPPQYLISPEFEGTTGMDVSFYYKNRSNSYPETFQVGYSTTTKSPSAFTWHDEVTANDANTWMLYDDYFPEGTKYVAVKCTSYDQFYLYIDDFSFLPACSPKTLPYTYGFEDEDDFGCWTTLDCAGPTGIVDYEEDHVFQFYYNYNPPQYLISPKLVCTTAMNVSFYYKNAADDYPESFQVGYSTTTKSPSAFTWSPEVTASDESIWMLYEDYFPAGTKYVAVKLNSNDMWKLYLDDFSFIPTFCPLEDQCRLTFTLTDSYGDTWNGNAIKVIDVATNTVLAIMANDFNNYEATSTSGTYTQTKTLPVCDGRELRFEWVKGQWAYECSYTITHSNGTVILEGSANNNMSTGYVLGTYTMDCSDVVQTIGLADGWNWWSTYIEQEGMDGLTMLEESLGTNGLLIKSSDAFVQYSSQSGGWTGTMNAIDNESGYKIDVMGACTLAMSGPMAASSDHPIMLSQGWNWIGYPVSTAQNITAALSGFVPRAGDVLKGQDGYTTYNGSLGWTPSTFVLSPGESYMYYSTATSNKTLVFAEAKGADIPAVTETCYWKTDRHAYPDNLSLMAVVEVDGVEQRDGNLELGAFVNGECRGSVKLYHVATIDRHIAFLTVTGQDGEQVDFRLLDESRATRVSGDRITFSSNAIVGNLDAPFPVHFGAMNDLAEMQGNVSVYPNPVDRNAPFTLSIPEEETVAEVLVVNAMGEVVIKEMGSLARSTMEGLPTAGVYMVKVTCKSGNVYVSRVVVK